MICKEVAIRKTETKMQNDYTLNSIVNAHVNVIYIYVQPLIITDFYSLIFLYYLLLYINSLLLIYFNYHLPFPVTGYQFNSISSYLVCSSQHKVTSTILGRQFSILLCQMLEALGQALTITDAVFCFGPEAHLVLIRLRGSVYYSCSQHLSRTGSSYQCIKTDLKISVQL